EGKDHSNEVVASDKVELSSQARDIQRAREVAQSAPEVRADKVEAARRALQSGKLNLKGQDLAEKILQDTLPSREQERLSTVALWDWCGRAEQGELCRGPTHTQEESMSTSAPLLAELDHLLQQEVEAYE